MRASTWLLPLALVASACGPGQCGRGEPEVFVERDGARLRRVDKEGLTGYYDEAGRLTILEQDKNKDGHPEQVDHHRDGSGTPYLTELDGNSDGKVERREYFSPEGRLQRVEEGVGKVEVWIEYDAAGRPERMKRDTDADGKPDRTEEYRNGVLSALEVDGDRDGRPERWQHWAGGHMEWEDLDTDGDGKPDRRLTYSARGDLLGVAPYREPAKTAATP